MSEPISGNVYLRLVDDCLSSHTCSSGDGEPKVCADPPAPFYDATVSVSAVAPDGTFVVQLDLGGDFEPMTCPGGPQEVCILDWDREWCGTRSFAGCPNGQTLSVSGTFIEFFTGIFGSDCNDVWVGTIVP